MSSPTKRMSRDWPTWFEKRQDVPEQFRRQGLFTDVELRVGDRQFFAHQLILSCHSEFFLNLFQSGMKECQEGVINFPDMEADVFTALLDYIYTGDIQDDLSFEVTRSLLLAANMWQMNDLEQAVLQRLVQICTPERCIKIFLFINGSGDLFGDRSVKQSVENILVETVRDRWHTVISPANHLECEKDDFVATLVDLDIESLKVVLSIKSEQEEIGDFSFSFNQTDLCLAVVQWIKYDISNRGCYLPELSEFYCKHQINSNATVSLMQLQGEIMKNNTFDVKEEICRGIWCPQRKIPGLVIAHAWSPHLHNKITCDHIFYYFTIPKYMSSTQSKPLHADFFYDLGQFGDLGDGEKHIINTNNCLSLGQDDPHMLLTYDSGKLSGTVIDPLHSSHQCKYHHSQMYRFCPSNVSECLCDFDNITLCVNDKGQVIVVPCLNCQKSEETYDPSCDTFLMVPRQVTANCESLANISEKISFVKGDILHILGGFKLEEGNMFSYVYCNFDLQDFGPMSGNADSSYKSGHSHLTTGLAYLKDTPVPNMSCRRIDTTINKNFEIDKDLTPLPLAIGNAATILHNGELWLVGGHDIAYDHNLQLFYQRPLASTWIFSWNDKKWRKGPDLPHVSPDPSVLPGVTKGSCYSYKGKLYFSGGAQLRVNEENESNQIYQYVPNLFCYSLTNDGKWEVVLELTRFASKFLDDAEYTVLSVFPAEVSLPRLKVNRSQIGSKFMVKYLNINFSPGFRN